MSVEVQEGPGNYDDHIQDQCVLITQAQPTEQRPPLSKLRKATKKIHECTLHLEHYSSRLSITEYQMVWTVVGIHRNFGYRIFPAKTSIFGFDPNGLGGLKSVTETDI